VKHPGGSYKLGKKIRAGGRQLILSYPSKAATNDLLLGDPLQVEKEVFHITDVRGNTMLSVMGAQMGTKAAPHAVGAHVTRIEPEERDTPDG
jgi:hypothetical protein